MIYLSFARLMCSHSWPREWLPKLGCPLLTRRDQWELFLPILSLRTFCPWENTFTLTYSKVLSTIPADIVKLNAYTWSCYSEAGNTYMTHRWARARARWPSRCWRVSTCSCPSQPAGRAQSSAGRCGSASRWRRWCRRAASSWRRERRGTSRWSWEDPASAGRRTSSLCHSRSWWRAQGSRGSSLLILKHR